MDEIIIEELKLSEKMRFSIEMKTLKLTIKNLTPKTNTLQKFEQLINDDKQLMKHHQSSEKIPLLDDHFSDSIINVSMYSVADSNNIFEDEHFEEYSSQVHMKKSAESIEKSYTNDSKEFISLSEKNTLSEKQNRSEEKKIVEEDLETEKNDDEEKISLSRDFQKNEFTKINKNKGSYEIVTDSLESVQKSLDNSSDNSFHLTLHLLPSIQMTTLPPFETLSVICIFEKALDQLEVLDTIDKIHSINDTDLEIIPFQVRMEREPYREPFYLIETCHINDKIFDREGPKKLQKERLLVLKTLSQTIQELKSSRTFNTLQKIIYDMIKSYQDENDLEKEWTYNKKKLSQLSKKQKKLQKKYKSDLLQIDMKEKLAAQEWEKMLFLLEAEQSYVQTWEEQWMADNKELLLKETNNLQDQIQYVSNKDDIENKGANEAKQFLIKYTEILNSEIQLWENKYDTEVNIMDIQILDLDQETEDAGELLSNIHTYYQKLQSSIDEYEKRKYLRERKIIVK